MLCGAMIDRVALDALVLKARFPELQLREGERGRPRGQPRGGPQVIVLAGVPLTAQLPPGVREGETLHLRVQEVTAERVTCGSTRRRPRPRSRPAPRRRRRGPPGSRSPTRRTGRPAATRRPGRRARLRFGGPRTARPPHRRGGGTGRGDAPAGRSFELASPPRRACRTRWRAAPPGAVRVTARREPFDAYACPEPPRKRATALRYEGTARRRSWPRAKARWRSASSSTARGGRAARGSRACGRAGRHGRGARCPRICGWRWRRCSCGRTSSRAGRLPRTGDVGPRPRADTYCDQRRTPEPQEPHRR